MSDRRLPVRPDLGQLKRQAKELLRALRARDEGALAEVRRFRPELAEHPGRARLADAQFVLARSYEAPSWARLAQACTLIDAIWRDDRAAVRALVTRHPHLLHEEALVRAPSNWGPPLTYAANVGRDEIVEMLHAMGGAGLERALGRAALRGKIGTARLVHRLLGRPRPPDDALGGPAYTLSAEGTALLLEFGARLRDDAGRSLAPIEVVLQTDSRNPAAKHAILELLVDHGCELPDTAVMALHRGRIDLLESHLRRDPDLLRRRFTHEEFFPPELGCRERRDATIGTPLDGATLLHFCMDFGEMEIARWLLDRGIDVNARARVAPDGIGGHTALFSTVVSQMNFWMNYGERGPFVAPFTELLLQHGADPNVRASLRQQLHPGYDDPRITELRDVTALSWGRRFHAPLFVSRPALDRIAAAGGVE